MALPTATVVEDRVQVDGRRAVRLCYVLADGAEAFVDFLAEPGANVEAEPHARRRQIASQVGRKVEAGRESRDREQRFRATIQKVGKRTIAGLLQCSLRDAARMKREASV